MLGRLLWGLLAAAVVGGVAAYVVKGIIDKRKIQEAMRDKGVQEAIVDTVYRSAKKVKLKDVRRGSTFEITGDGISNEISEGMRIYA